MMHKSMEQVVEMITVCKITTGPQEHMILAIYVLDMEYIDINVITAERGNNHALHDNA